MLLTGLAVAIAQWCRRQGRGVGTAFLLNVEGHGREAIFPDVDLSRTVGWFTSIYPVHLDVGSLDVDEAMRGGPALGRAFKLIKEQLHAIPNHGLGYGLLRYLNPQTAALLKRFAEPRIGFNYLGRFPSVGRRDWTSAEESDVLGDGYDPGMSLAHALEINAVALDDSEGITLSATFSWAPVLIADADVRALAQDWFRVLEALVSHVMLPGAGGRTPSDLPLVSLSQAEIERIEELYPRIEDILPLSPLQEGLLFHALYEAQGPDIYTLQVVFDVDGALDSEALHAAANALVQRHANLRAAFEHENLSQPVQVILPAVQLPWRSFDLSRLDDATRAERLRQILAEDRVERFDFACPPLLRFTLLRLGEDQYRLVFTHHHILVDGWSMAVLLQELLTLYADRGATALPRVTPYRDYLAWLAAQDSAAAAAAWREVLAGLEEPTVMAPRDPRRPSLASEKINFTASEALTSALIQQSRARGLTLNTYVQAAWAILLGRLTGRDDVVFGVTVAGRPPEMPGIESMVGLFINTLPLRVKLPSHKPIVDLLVKLQDTQSRLMAHQHLGLAEIQGDTGLGQLFDTLVVFENYPVDRAGSTAATDRLRLMPVDWYDASHYSLSLMAGPGERLQLRLEYRPDLFERQSIEALGSRLVRLLEAAVAAPDRRSAASTFSPPPSGTAFFGNGNDTARPIEPATLPELFAAQAARTPDAVAVVFEQATLSYGELDARANQLAHHLQSLGVGPETIVGLCVDRSLEMVIALLGILKAGGAYCRSILPIPHNASPSCWKTQRSYRDHSGDAARPAAGLRRPHRATRRRLAAYWPPTHKRAGEAPPPRHHRLYDLHVGVYRHT